MSQSKTATRHDIIARMQILTLITSSVALILSGYVLYRTGTKPAAQPPTVGTKPAAQPPTVGTKGAGGGGW